MLVNRLPTTKTGTKMLNLTWGKNHLHGLPLFGMRGGTCIVGVI